VEAESLATGIALSADHPNTHQAQLIRAQVQRGRGDDARKTIDLLQQRFPGSTYPLWLRVEAMTGLQDLPAAERAIADFALASRTLLDKTRAANAQTQLSLTEGRLADAERFQRQANGFNDERGLRGISLRRALNLPLSTLRLRGDTTAALDQLAAILRQYPLDSIAPLDRPGARVALVYAMAGRLADARKTLTQYESYVPEGYRRAEWEWYQARGWIALLAGDGAGAAKTLISGRTARFCHDCGFGDEAIAWERAGQMDSARAAYERAVAPGSIWKAARGDPLSLAPSLKRLGELYEDRGDKAKALESYGRFIEVWKNADIVLQPQVREVKSRMAKLAGEGSR
jgi:tetratricopeptide (TPR) repeat protein